MTQQERIQVGELMAIMSAYYGRDLKPQTLSLMLDDLNDLPGHAVMGALTTYRRDPKNRTFPLPAQIRAIIEPPVDHDAAAREIAGRIVGAIKKFGWPNPTEAREYMGEVGWQIVQRSGGWLHLCENHGVGIDPTAFHAQARDQAKASLMFPAPVLEKAIGIESRRRDQLAIPSAAEILGGLQELK